MNAPPPPCPICGRRHRSWPKLAACVLRPLLWAAGSGPWACVARCYLRRPRGGITVTLHPDRAGAERSLPFIDKIHPQCHGQHQLINLADPPGGQP